MIDTQKQTQTSAPFMSPLNQYGGTIVQLTNPEGELYKMELTLRSQILDADGNPVQIGQPLLSDEGISSVIGQVQTIINQATVMSNFTDKDIPLLVDYLADTLAQDLMQNRVKYNITNTSARSKIFFAACTGSFIILKRAMNNGERGFWKGSQQDIRQIIETGDSKSKGLFGALGWGKKT